MRIRDLTGLPRLLRANRLVGFASLEEAEARRDYWWSVYRASK